MSGPPDRRALLALLDWYVESGADMALDDAPHDRYAESARAPEQPVATRPAPLEDASQSLPPSAATPRTRRESPIVAPDAAARAAQEEAAAARDLEDLARRLEAFEYAPFRDMARHFVLSAGARDARLMAFDIAPGAEEELSGEPFNGPRARLLDNMLRAISLDRESARLAYFSPWRPPGDRPLTPHETAVFAPFARRHVELTRPEVLLLFGEAPARALIATNEPFSKLRGRAFDLAFGDHAVAARVFSPLDAILKSAALKPAAWRELRAAATLLR
jgi:DNA polymerase